MRSPPNSERLVLGGIEAKVCKYNQKAGVEALDEIYKIYRLLHRTELKFQQKVRFFLREYSFFKISRFPESFPSKFGNVFF